MNFEPKEKCDGCPFFSNYCVADGTHIHQCDECNTTWQHVMPPDNISNKKAHACPKCGAEQRYKLRLSLANALEKIDFPWTGEWPKEWELTPEEIKEREERRKSWLD